MDLGELVLRLRLDDQIGAGLNATKKNISGFGAGLGKQGSTAGAQFGNQFGRGATASMGRVGNTIGRQLASGIGRAAVGGVAGSIGTAIGKKIYAGVSTQLGNSKMFAKLTGSASKAGAEAGTKIATGIGKGTSNINWSRLGKVGLAAAAVGAGVLFARDFNRAANAGMGRLHPVSLLKGFAGGLASGFAGIVAGLGRVVIGGLVTAAAAGTAVIGTTLGIALKKGFGRLEAIDTARGKLTGLGHDAKEVDLIMRNALASVKGTAFGLDDAATVAASAVAAGIKPGKDLTSTLKLVGDAATIGGSSMSDMGAIFNRVKSSNKVMGDSLAQLGDQGIPIVQFLSKTMHKSADDVVDLASKGKINFKTFKQAMQDGLGGSAKASGDTLKGTLDNVGAAVSRAGAGLLKGIFPQLKGVGASITGALDSALPAIQKIGGSLGSAFSSTLPTIKTFASVLSSAFGSPTAAAQKFADVVATHQATIFSFLVFGARLALSFGRAFLQMGAGALTAVAWIVRQMANLQDTIVGVIGSILPAMAAAFSWVPGIGPQLAAAAANFDSFAAASKRTTDGVRGTADEVDGAAASLTGMEASLAGAQGKLEKLAAQKMDGLKKSDEINQVKIALRGLPKDIKTKVMTVYKKGGLEAALAKLKELKDKRVRARVDADTKNLPKLQRDLKGLKDKLVKAKVKGDGSDVDKLQDKIRKLKGRIINAKVHADTKGADDAKRKTNKKNLPDREISITTKSTADRDNDKGGGSKTKSGGTVTFKSTIIPPKMPLLPKGQLRIRSTIISPKLPPLPRGARLKIASVIVTPKAPRLPKASKLNIGSVVARPKAPKLPKGGTVKVGVKTETSALGRLSSKLAGLKPKPVVVKTKENLSGVKAVANAAKLRPKAVNITTKANMSGINSVRSGLSGLNNKTITITTVKKTVGGATGGLFTGSDFRYAAGGPVRDVTRGGYAWGGGNATSDSINARIAKGEFVQKESATRYYGTDFMSALNRMSIPKEALGLASRATVDTKPSKQMSQHGSTYGQSGATVMPGAIQVHLPTASDTAASHAAQVVVDALGFAGVH